MEQKNNHILALATQGAGGNDEARLKELLSQLNVTFFPFSYKQKVRSFFSLLKILRKNEHSLIVMEGTGLAGGIALIIGSIFYKKRYLFSSGDAISPFLTNRVRILKPFFNLYEKLLCKRSSGIIGWTPYFVGRAITYGAPKGVTAAGWNPHTITDKNIQLKESLGIPQNKIVVGIVGALSWNNKKKYCYGMELVKAAHLISNTDIVFLIIGDGNGKKYLEQEAKDLIGNKIFFTGYIDRSQLSNYFSIIDIGSLPQSLDQVGLFRYSTKLSEYYAFKIPFMTGHLPLAYDLSYDWCFRVKGKYPWDTSYINNLANLLNNITKDHVRIKQSKIPNDLPVFNKESQINQVTQFIQDIL